MFKGPGRLTLTQWKEYTSSFKKKLATPALPKLNRKLDRFVVTVNNKQYKLKAYTKGEARKQLKEILGGPVPVGTILKKV